jgi:GNAT superfamily N-acetyltransferase
MNAAAAAADYPRTVVLTDGTHVVLRPAGAADAAALDALGTRLSAAERARLAAPAELRVVAIAVDAVAGVGLLGPGDDGGERRVDVLLDPAYRGRRLGTWMLLDLVHLASALGAERLVARHAAADAAFAAALHRLDFAADAAGAVVKRLHAAWTDF